MAQAPRSSKLREGDLVAGRYRLIRRIGGGSMGEVWAARHELLARDFALKVAAVPVRSGAQIRARFLREAQIIGHLRHPNVVDVADVGELEGSAHLYLAMELLEGQSLAERIDARGPLDPSETLAIAIEICRGLAAAHAAGVIHRDIKPENIFLARGASGGIVPKLVDFGISKRDGSAIVTLPGQLFGTPAYMSPEQALGELDIDHRTDLWSLGVVLFEMLTATHPFTAESYPALLPLIAEGPTPALPPEVPPSVQAIVQRCLEKSRKERFQSADALREALESAQSDIGAPVSRRSTPPVERPHALPSYRPVRQPARSLSQLLIGGALLVGLGAAVAVGVSSSRHAAAPATPSASASVTAATSATATAEPMVQAPASPPPASPAFEPSASPTSAPRRAATTAVSRPSAPAAPRPKAVTKIESAVF
ncbi:MAG: serine/threonine-protein kinase [Byssovorax sp.]